MDASPKEEKGDTPKNEKDGSLKSERVALRGAPPQTQCTNFPFSRIALMAYRIFVAIGIIIAIVILIKFQQKQNQILDVLVTQTNATRERLTISDAMFRHLNAQQSKGVTLLPNQGNKTHYVVNSSECAIPDYPEFHEDVKPYYRKMEAEECSSVPPLTSLARTGTHEDYVLKLLKNNSVHYHVDEDELECCYSFINTNKDDRDAVDDCPTFYEDVKLIRPSSDLVAVRCEDGNSSVVYKNVHILVSIKEGLRNKFDVMLKEGAHFMSVMVVGFGSVSRLNLLRTMPRTVEYLKTNRWFGFEGHHKIHRGRFDDLIGPVLTGLTKDHLNEICPDDKMDSCPWIWKIFSERYYVTAYGEDAATKDSFESLGRFKNPPTDYFLRPAFRAIETIFETEGDYPYCLGVRRSADYVLDFSAEFASRFVEYPTFSVFWMNSVGDDLNRPARVDKKFVAYLEELKISGALNRTMVVFMSDHGFQKNGFRTTYMGFLEDSLPFLYVWMPEKFRVTNSKKVLNLKLNKNRLTSHFDLFTTFKDLLGVTNNSVACRRCVSLFDPVPIDRSCADAGIPDDVCACVPYDDIPTNSTVVEKMSQVVTDHVNGLSSNFSESLRKGFRCANVTVKNVISAWRQKIRNPDGRLYVIQLETNFGDKIEGVFQGAETKIEYVSELKDSARCMSSREGRKWCVCERE